MLRAFSFTDRVRRPATWPLVRAAVAGVALALTLTACSGGEEPSATESDTTTTPEVTASPSETQSPPYFPVPAGVELTEPGSELTVGQPATVAWQPTQKVTGVLDVTVTRLTRTTFAAFKGFKIDAATARKTPYFVKATVRNAGRTDLAGRPVPLYAATDANTLVEASTFSEEFKPCRPGVLPSPFPAGGKVNVCLVYLVPPGSGLTGVTFRPYEEFDPITWTGPLAGAGASSSAPASPRAPKATPSPSPTS